MKRFLYAASFLLGLFLFQTPFARGQLIIGHRGASYDAPENTLAAFRLAWERGADGVEGDFYLSSDGRVVCIHDADTERTAGVKLVVAQTPFEKLRTLEVGSWKDERWRGEKIPSMEEVLAIVPPGKKIFIELKMGPEIVEPIAEILDASSLRPEQIVIICFNAEAIQAFEKRMPELRSHWLTGYKEKESGKGTWKPTAMTVGQTLHRIGADGLGSQAKPEYVNGAFLGKLRDAGIREFHFWTINDPQVARNYQKLGAWSLTTDRPGWLRGQLLNPGSNDAFNTGCSGPPRRPDGEREP